MGRSLWCGITKDAPGRGRSKCRGSHDWRLSVKSFLLSHTDAFNLGEVVRLGLQSLGRSPDDHDGLPSPSQGWKGEAVCQAEDQALNPRPKGPLPPSSPARGSQTEPWKHAFPRRCSKVGLIQYLHVLTKLDEESILANQVGWQRRK